MLELGAGFNPLFTGRENVILGASVLGLSAAEIKSRFDEIEAFADIGHFIDEPVRFYSSGMYARLAFAVCAHVNADILIVDEILTVGDAAFQQKCMRFLNRFRQKGTLLFVSHDSAAVVQLCDKVLWLDHGTVRDYGDAREMCRRYYVAQSELMAEETQRLSRRRPVEAAAPPTRAAGPRRRLRLRSRGARSRRAAAPPFWKRIFAMGMATPWARQPAAKISNCMSRPGPEQAIEKPVVAFTLRDRLAQVLLGDDTHSVYGEAPPAIAGAQDFVARFKFRLPHLSSGSYAVEIFLFDGDVLLVHRQDAVILHVQSRHISTGLANLAIRGVRLSAATP